MEDLQDKPELIKKEILGYLEDHVESIDKIEIESSVDENTFKPSVVLRIHTNIKMNSDSILNKF